MGRSVERRLNGAGAWCKGVSPSNVVKYFLTSTESRTDDAETTQERPHEFCTCSQTLILQFDVRIDEEREQAEPHSDQKPYFGRP